MIQFLNKLFVIYLSKTSTWNGQEMGEKGENGLGNHLTFHHNVEKPKNNVEKLTQYYT